MRRLYTLLLLGAFLIAGLVSCSDDGNEADTPDPFLPVTGLEIPQQQQIDTIVRLQGKGFREGCGIRLQVNGSEEAYDVEVVEVTGESLAFSTAGLKPGFYIVLLLQNEHTYRIGAINLVSDFLNSDDIDAIGVVGEESPKIYTISVAKKMRGDLLFSLSGDLTFYGGLVHGKTWYYLAYHHEDVSNWRNLFTLGAYDLETKTNTEIFTGREGVLSIGVVDGKLNVFGYDATKCYVNEWDGTAFREVVSFPNTEINRMFLVRDGIFVYDRAKHSLVMSGQDMRGDTRQFIWTIDLNNPGLGETGGAPSISFHLVDCNGTVYAFGQSEISDSRTDTYIFKLPNPSDWQYAALTPECILEKASLAALTYQKSKNVIHGIDDGTVMTYDMRAKQLSGGMWVDSGLVGIFLLNPLNKE